MTRLKIILLCLILTLAASACGLKGSLYLPDADTDAPASEESEEEKDDDTEPPGSHLINETHP